MAPGGPVVERTDYLSYPCLCGDGTLEQRIENVCLNMAYDAAAAGAAQDHPDIEGHLGLLAERARDALLRVLDDDAVRALELQRSRQRLMAVLPAERRRGQGRASLGGRERSS